MDAEGSQPVEGRMSLPARTQVFLGSAAADAPTDVVHLGERLNRILVTVAKSGGTVESLETEVLEGWFYVRLAYRVKEGVDFNPYRT
jgi:hypothetical protein